MILLHRITTFALAGLSAAIFGLLLYVPDSLTLALGLTVFAFPLLFARLLKWEVKRFVFWVFLSLPIFLLFSALLFFFFLEAETLKWTVGLIVTLGVWVYAESVFAFYHLPSTYQAYTLEYLSMIFSILSAFFFTSGMYAMGMFLQLPVWVPSVAVALFTFFLSLVVLWVSKVATQVALRYAIVTGVLMSEVYIAFSLLPTSFLANASAFAVVLYTLLGLSRAQALEKLSKPVLIRYLLIATGLLLVIFLTARWI